MFSGRRQPSCDDTSRMMREYQVRICERLGVKFPGPTRHFEPSSCATCTEELAQIPDAREANCWPGSRRRSAATSRRQVLPSKPPLRPAAVASPVGQELPCGGLRDLSKVIWQ